MVEESGRVFALHLEAVVGSFGVISEKSALKMTPELMPVRPSVFKSTVDSFLMRVLT